MKREHIIWVEKYRPTKVADCILPERIKKSFEQYVTKKEIPNLLLFGPRGAGKTTIAKAMCDEVGCDWMLINGSEESGIDTLRTKIRTYASTLSLRGGRKVIIIDEADYMNANSLQPAMRSAIEEFSRNCSFIFTCNHRKRLIPELRSRFAEVDFKLQSTEKSQMAALFLKRVEAILDQEKVSYKESVVIQVIKKYFPDFRKVINELQRYVANSDGEINEGILTQFVDVDLKELMKSLKDKDYSSVRKWVHRNGEADPSGVYRSVYEQISSYIKPHSLPSVILILAKYDYQTAFAADVEIQLLACLTELMVECEWV